MQLTFDKRHQMMRLSTGYVTFKRMLNMELNFELHYLYNWLHEDVLHVNKQELLYNFFV